MTPVRIGPIALLAVMLTCLPARAERSLSQANWTLSEASQAAAETDLLEMLKPLPLSGITSLLGIILVLVFFVTSSDSGSLVVDTITAGGKLEAPVSQRVFWASFEGLVAIALLVGGGLQALRAAAISTGLPFALVLLLMCVSLIVGLRQELRHY